MTTLLKTPGQARAEGLAAAAILNQSKVLQFACVNCTVHVQQATTRDRAAQLLAAVFSLRGFLQFKDATVLVCHCEFVAKSLPLADDGFALLLAFFVELVDMLNGTPVCDVPLLTHAEETVEHAAASQQSDMTLM
jgi:hypothetical protein